MLTKIQNPRINYLSRILALTILAATVLAFTLRTKNITTSPLKLDKQITVVIDAGHGMQNGKYSGARDGDVYEDEITLAIADKIKQLNTNNQLKIILTRPSEEIVDLYKRVDIANEHHADLFLSLHVNAYVKGADPAFSSNQELNSGIGIYVSNKQTTYQQESETVGSILQQELNSIYPTNPYLLKRKVGVWVLDQNVCPSVLVECGFITNKKDKEFITKDDNQNLIAEKILQAIERYGLNKQKFQNTSIDTLPKKEVQVQGVTIRQQNASAKEGPKETDRKNLQNFPLYIVNGKEMDKIEMEKIDPSTIQSINVLKGDTAKNKYGSKGANGVIEIWLKTSKTVQEVTLNPKPSDTIPKTEPLFTKVEVEPAVDKEEWSAFLRKNLQPVIEQTAINGAKPGTYTVKVTFIVKKDGTVSNFKALNDPGYGLADEVVSMMKDSPRWKPALQNGKPVNAYHIQPVTFVIEEQ